MNETLKEFFLADNRLMPSDGIHLGNMLKYNNHLQLLDLRNNHLQVNDFFGFLKKKFDSHVRNISNCFSYYRILVPFIFAPVYVNKQLKRVC